MCFSDLDSEGNGGGDGGVGGGLHAEAEVGGDFARLAFLPKQERDLKRPILRDAYLGR